jgi:hypothetical protein
MAYSSDDPATRLAAVRAAIDRCLTSQAYSVRGRNQQTASLSALMALEEKLQQEVADSANGGGMASLAIPTRAT